MSIISRRQEKNGNGNELSGACAHDGSAARTRPFSFEEIMMRRKARKVTADANDGAGDPSNLSRQDNVENVSHGSELDGGYRHGRDSDYVIAKHASEDIKKRSSRKVQEAASSKERNLVKDGGKESRDSGTNLKGKSDKDSGRGKERKNERQSHHRSRNEERVRSEKETKKKHSEKLLGNEKYIDSVRLKSERESKRKHRSRDEGRNKLETDGNVKKHDSGKYYNSDPAEGKDRKKDTSKSHYEGSGKKRRRSRSRDSRARDRSVSLSPRVHKRAYDEREHVESSLHSSKDRKQHSDVDRNRTSSNGGHTSSHNWRHGGRGSRLGGYSPRKRRSEAAIKTPSPTIRSPERKSAGWDLPPTGTGSMPAGTMLSNFQSLNQSVPKTEHELVGAVPSTPNDVGALSGALPSSVSITKDVPVDSIKLTQATQPTRRLYVENLPASASDKSVMKCLNDFLLSSAANRIQGTERCISCIINKEKGQALVEFLTAEDATEALSFDGRSLFGSVLKFRRPNDLIDAATGEPEKSIAAVDAISDIVKDSPHKIFIGGISKALSSDMLMEIVCAFGHLKAYRFRVNEDLNEPCAFLEYIDQSITLKACAGLSGMKLGEKVLTVVQAAPDASLQENSEKLPFYGIPEHAKPLLSKPTKVLKLKNVFNSEDLSSLSGSELEETLEDIRIECARFGTVKSVNIVKCESSCATDIQAYVTADQTDTSILQDPKGDGFTKKTETLEEDIDHKSGEIRRSESPRNVNEPLEIGGDAEDERGSDDKPQEVLAKNEISELCQLDSSLSTRIPTCNLNTDANPQEVPSQVNATKDQCTNGTEIVQSEDMSYSLVVEEELKQEEANNELQEASIQMNDIVGGESESSERGESKQQVSDLNDVFEEGYVLVEYARTEASCVAAHCLHGRLYGDRIVLVNYIPHDLYLSKFPK